MKRLLILPIVSFIGAAMFSFGFFTGNETPVVPDATIIDNAPMRSDNQAGEYLQNLTTRYTETTPVPSAPVPSTPAESETAPIIDPEIPAQTTTRFTAPGYNVDFTREPEIETLPPVVTTTTTAMTTTPAPVVTTTKAPVVTTTKAPVVTTTKAPVVTTTKAPQTTKVPEGNTPAGVILNVPLYDQNDSRWANKYIGTQKIGDIGCITTCISMVYSYHVDKDVYPHAMVSKLRYSNNDLIWGSLKNVNLTYKTYNQGLSNSMLKNIYNILKSGKPVIIGATTSGGGYQHWVVITGYTGSSTTKFSTSNFTINDPGSAECDTLAEFLENGSRSDRTYIKKIIY